MKFLGWLFGFIFIFTSCLSQFIKGNDRLFAVSDSLQLTSVADSLWGKMPLRPKELDKEQDLIKESALFEITNRKYRKWAIEFWERFPDDPRRFKAMLTALNKVAFYWKDPIEGAELYNKYKGKVPIPVDIEAVEKWRMTAHNFSNEYLASIVISNREKLGFRKTEIHRYLFGIELLSESRQQYKLNKDSALAALENSVLAALEIDSTDIYGLSSKGGNTVSAAVERFFKYREAYKWTFQDLNEFFEMGANSSIHAVRNICRRKLSILKLQQNPIEFKFKDVNGVPFDIKNLRGKVVLLDFWAVWCGSCIAEMQRIKPIYDKLKDNGFEILSISIDPESRKEQVLSIKNKIGFTWPLFIIGGKNENDESSLFKKIWDTYGFATVPQLILIDKNGLLVEYKGELLTENKELLINNYLFTQDEKK